MSGKAKKVNQDQKNIIAKELDQKKAQKEDQERKAKEVFASKKNQDQEDQDQEDQDQEDQDQEDQDQKTETKKRGPGRPKKDQDQDQEENWTDAQEVDNKFITAMIAKWKEIESRIGKEKMNQKMLKKNVIATRITMREFGFNFSEDQDQKTEDQDQKTAVKKK